MNGRNIRKSILQAADYIEGHPEEFNFWNNTIPRFCGSPGCALGWIGYFAGIPDRGSAQASVSCYLGTDSATFYQEMDRLTLMGWLMDHVLAAHGLRLYADKHFQDLPDWEAIAQKRAILSSEVCEGVT